MAMESLRYHRLVVGLRDKKLLEQLQMHAGLTLDRAVTSAQKSQQVKKQQELTRTNF